jgi:hypothetical protein
MTETTTNGTPPDARRLRLHRALCEKIGNQVADDLVDFLPPAGWGDLVRRADLDAAVARLDQTIDALGARLDQRIDALEERLDQRIEAIELALRDIKSELRELGNLKRTIVVTGTSMAVSIILGSARSVSRYCRWQRERAARQLKDG